MSGAGVSRQGSIFWVLKCEIVINVAVLKVKSA